MGLIEEEIANKLFRVASGRDIFLGMFILFYEEATYILKPDCKSSIYLMVEYSIDTGWKEDVQKWVWNHPRKKSLHKYEELPVETLLTYRISHIRNIAKKIIRNK